jgi:hypothetical protein
MLARLRIIFIGLGLLIAVLCGFYAVKQGRLYISGVETLANVDVVDEQTQTRHKGTTGGKTYTLHYRYTVDGIDYTFESLSHQRPEGSVTIRYLPDHPKVANIVSLGSLLGSVGLTCVLFAGVGMLIFCKRRAATQPE